MQTIKDYIIIFLTKKGYFGAVNEFFNVYPKIHDLEMISLLSTKIKNNSLVVYDYEEGIYSYLTSLNNDYEFNHYNLNKAENIILNYIKLCYKLDPNFPISIKFHENKWEKIKEFFSQNIF